MAPVDQFIAAIVQQESGGNYNARSSAGALGKYQIMANNIPVWSQQYLGRTITANQYMSDPALQDQLGRAVLQDYFNRYGAAGAASAWYSGNPNAYTSTKSQPGGPSISGYVQSVMNRMGSVQGVNLNAMPTNSPLNPDWLANQLKTDAKPEPEFATQPLGLNALDGTTASGAGLEAADGTAPSLAYGSAPAPDLKLPGYGPGPTSGTSTSAPAAGGPATGIRAAAIAIGKKYLGVPYVWGGTSDYGLDCSGLVQKVLGQVGIKTPRVSYDQLKMGPRVDISRAQPGDLIGWGDGHHVAIYLGNGQILEAPRTGLNVRIRALGSNEGTFAVSLQNYYKG